MKEDSHEKGFLNFVEKVSNVGVKSNISNARMGVFQNLFQKKQFKQIMVEMKEDMRLKTRIFYKFIPDSEIISSIRGNPFSSEILRMYKEYDIPFNRNKEPATIRFSDPPPFGTKSFENHRFEISIGETMQYESAESFVYLLAHEFSHIVLYSIRHPLMDSEFATDICAIILGYGDVMRKGRILAGKVKLGYLTDQQFEIACGVVDEKKPYYAKSGNDNFFFDAMKSIFGNYRSNLIFDKF